MSAERFQKLPVAMLGQSRTAENHDIQSRQFRLVYTEALPHQALDAISSHRTANVLFRYRQPEARNTRTVKASQCGETGVHRPYGCMEYPLEFAGFQ